MRDGMRTALANLAAKARGIASLLRGCEGGVTSIEYLLVAALVVVVFASLRFTLLVLLLGLYKFFIEMICSPVL
jgi:hypothetical protein